MLTERFETALAYAARLHAGQRRKGADIPYISHLIGVAGIALDFGADEDEAIAALLHDAVEDKGGLAVLEEIRSRYGGRVADIVDGCTDSYVAPKPPWRQRKEEYLRKAPGASKSVRLVSAADKLHNVQAILRDHRQVGEAVWDRFNAPPGDILWYYSSIVEAFRSSGSDPLVEELGRQVEALRSIVRTRHP
jgi:(p)ppGpp synthase/HD superfamily hydrolase